MRIVTVERQNFICCMEWQRLCFTTRFYEADKKNPPQKEIERAKRNLTDYQWGKQNEGK